jgi:hypothetical protein
MSCLKPAGLKENLFTPKQCFPLLPVTTECKNRLKQARESGKKRQSKPVKTKVY